jgi:uncharacterized protein
VKALVLYHGNCADGFGAAWAAHLHFEDSAEYLPVNYGEQPPDVTGREVYMLDFSFPRAVLLSMKERAKSLLVLDHHATAEADLRGLDFCVFDMERSGATMAWDYFLKYGTDQEYFNAPWFVSANAMGRDFVEYLTDRDLWRFALPDSREVSAAIWSYPMDFNVWTGLAMRVESLKDEGRHILRYMQQQTAVMAERAVMRDVGGYTVPVVNATMLLSEVGEALVKRFPDAPFGAYYFDRPGGIRQWGARSSGFDVSVVAKALGGGGHKQAAGWTEKIA